MVLMLSSPKNIPELSVHSTKEEGIGVRGLLPVTAASLPRHGAGGGVATALGVCPHRRERRLGRVHHHLIIFLGLTLSA